MIAVALYSGLALAQSYLESEVINIGGADLLFDSAGYAHVGGIVDSYNFPGIDSGAITNAGYGLRYVAKIDPATRKPMWVTVVGAPTKALNSGPSHSFVDDEVRGLALHSNGFTYLVAYDGSTNFPLTGGQYQLATSKYVFRVSPTGQVSRFSTALDPAIRRVGAIALDAVGNIYLTGSATGGLLTTANAPFPVGSVAPGCIAPYVLKLDPTGQSTSYASYLGYAGTQGERCGSGSALGVFDPTGFAMAVDATGNAVVGGQAEPGVRATAGSPDTGSKQATMYIPTFTLHASHAFVTKIDAAGTAIIFSARLGGAERDRVTSIALDTSGAVYVGGKTSSSGFPSTPDFGPVYPYSSDSCPGYPSNAPEMGFVSKLSADGRQILYSGFMPVYGEQLANCGGSPGTTFAPVKIVLDSTGRVYATGTHSYQRAYTASPNSILTLNAQGLFYVISADGRTVEYSTPYAGISPHAAAIDSWGHYWVVGSTLKRFSIGSLPVEFTNSIPLCAPSGTVSARVAGANNFGIVEFFVDGVSAGTAGVANSLATKSVALPPGARKLLATYHGSSYFDGYSSEPTYMPVNQTGACQ